MRYSVGQKVVITSKNPESIKHLICGHICTVKEVVHRRKYSFFLDAYYDCFYVLQWYQQDNPGRKPVVVALSYNWFEGEMTPYCNTSFLSGELPDI